MFLARAAQGNGLNHTPAHQTVKLSTSDPEKLEDSVMVSVFRQANTSLNLSGFVSLLIGFRLLLFAELFIHELHADSDNLLSASEVRRKMPFSGDGKRVQWLLSCSARFTGRKEVRDCVGEHAG
jgi:hypothetical protein